jgi:hypothetical protein
MIQPTRIRGALAAAGLAVLLAGCASTSGGGVASTPHPPKRGTQIPNVRQPTHTARDPSFQAIPGAEGVIGSNESQLVRMFGEPRLNVWEGDARKLQFTGKACLLDIYLYPSTSAKEPRAADKEPRGGWDGAGVESAPIHAARRQWVF